MYDDNRRLRPDFQVQLPQWVPMGDDDQEDQTAQATGSFVDLLKKRMMGNKAADLGGGSTYTPGGTRAVRPRTTGMSGGSGEGSGGGMQSL